MPDQHKTRQLQGLIKLLLLLFLLAVAYVVFDFFTTSDEQRELRSYRVDLPTGVFSQPWFFRVEHIPLVLVESKSPAIENSQNRETTVRLFIALGTDLGCPLKVENKTARFRESCSNAQWYYDGSPVTDKAAYTALKSLEFHFCPDRSCIHLEL